MVRFLLASLAILVTGCSWVSVDKGAEDVLVLPAERLAPDCESLGLVTVSVLDRVGVLERHDEEVVEDLDVLARNHAARVGGDTAVPRGPAENGQRRYEIFRCTQGKAQAQPARESDSEDIEVLPYENGDG